MSDPATATAAIEGTNAAKGIFEDRAKSNQEDNARRDADMQKNDRLNREEASKRFDRQMIQNSLAAYYKKQGWQMPDPSTQLPGYGTSRQLPFEDPLYAGDKSQSPFQGNDAPLKANKEPSQPTYTDPNQPTDGTDGSSSAQAQSAQNPNAQDSGNARNDAPTENAQQTSAKNLNSILDGNPKKIYDWSKLKPL